MKKLSVITLCFFAFWMVSAQKSFLFNSVMVDTILKEKRSIRAIVIDGNKIWYAADKGYFGYFNIQSGQKFQSNITNSKHEIEFRSIAKTANHIFVLNIGNPALLYQISKEGKQTKLVYQEDDEKIFYDSMQFWNDRDGIAIGDPMTDCLSIIVTHDGGNTWTKIPCEQLPKTVVNEAAFAASNTNIVAKGNKTWIVSGGKKSRIFYSPDQAETWYVFETPIIQGSAMAGIFTADFYNDNIGFIAGGNYEIPNQNFGNKPSPKTAEKTGNWLLKMRVLDMLPAYNSCLKAKENNW